MHPEAAGQDPEVPSGRKEAVVVALDPAGDSVFPGLSACSPLELSHLWPSKLEGKSITRENLV